MKPPTQATLPLEPPRQVVVECNGHDLHHHCANLRERGYHLTRLEALSMAGYRITAERAELFKASTTGPLPAGSS